jgi:hypothetical protein
MLHGRKSPQQLAVADGDDSCGEALPGKHHAQLGPDARRLAAGERDDRRLYRSSSRISM